MTVNYFHPASEHQHLAWIGGSTVDILLDSAQSNGQLLLTRSNPVHGEAVPLHRHTHEDETFVILEGEMVVWVGDQRQEVRAGDVAFLPREIPRTYTVTSETAKMLVIVTPGGLEAGFRGAGWDLSKPMPEGWTCTREAVAEAMGKVGTFNLGPPKSPTDGPLTR